MGLATYMYVTIASLMLSALVSRAQKPASIECHWKYNDCQSRPQDDVHWRYNCYIVSNHIGTCRQLCTPSKSAKECQEYCAEYAHTCKGAMLATGQTPEENLCLSKPIDSLLMVSLLMNVILLVALIIVVLCWYARRHRRIDEYQPTSHV